MGHKLILQLDDDLTQRVGDLAARRGVSKSALTRWALSSLCDSQEKPEVSA